MSLDLSSELLAQAEAAITGALPAKPSNDGLLQLVETMRARHRDEADPFFGKQNPGHLDRIAKSQLDIDAMLLRAGAKPVAVTPATVAAAQHAARWSVGDQIPLHLHSMISERVAAAEAADKTDRGARDIRIAAARRELGDATYARLVAEAGSALPAAALGDVTVIRLFATQGRYAAAKKAAEPR